jgi:hypothetical protein
MGKFIHFRRAWRIRRPGIMTPSFIPFRAKKHLRDYSPGGVSMHIG